jgi:steroid 5-alpha reductase family enzyme
MLGEVLLWSAGVLLGYVLALWLLSLALRDVSIVDPGWAVGFVLVAWLAFALGDGCRGRRLLLAALVSLWGMRLAVYLIARKLSHPGEDPRYGRLRRRYRDRFALVSLVIVFLLQGVLMWVISLPIQRSAPEPDRLGAIDAVGGALWAVGVFFEAVGDWQLQRFKRDPGNAGKVMDRGLWRYTRHPNYFGDFLVWWGIYVVAAATGDAWWTVVSPLVLSTLLIRVSGKKLLEDHMRKRPAYAEYVERTSGFFPLPPRRSGKR